MDPVFQCPMIAATDGLGEPFKASMNQPYLVQTQSCYVALLDQASPVNTTGFMDAEFKAAKNRALETKQDEVWSLFIFNDQLLDAAKQGNLLAWTLLFDGVFQVDVQLVPQAALPSSEVDNLGANALWGTLVCPTGKMIVACLSRLGEPQTPMMEVEPGTYQVVLERNADAEFEHTLLESLAQYPVGEGPDWRIRLRRVDAL